MTRALITGSTGCVGSNLAAALTQMGVEVVGMCHPSAPTIALEGIRMKRIEGDILNPDSVRKAMQDVDWVFHVAAIADDWKFPAEKVYQTNVEGTKNVLAAALELKVGRLVLTASAAILGTPRPGIEILDETSPFNMKPGDWIYAHSKLLAEQALQEAVSRGLNAVSVLPTAIMGPADMSFISGQMITRVLKGEAFPFPDGGANFVDVRDVASAHIAAALHGKPGERYLLGGQNMSHLHSLGAISDVLGVPVNYIHIPKFTLPLMAGAIGQMQNLGIRVPIDRGRVLLSSQYMYYDHQKAARELNHQPRPFENSVMDAYQWYLEHGFLNQYRIPRRVSFGLS